MKKKQLNILSGAIIGFFISLLVNFIYSMAENFTLEGKIIATTVLVIFIILTIIIHNKLERKIDLKERLRECIRENRGTTTYHNQVEGTFHYNIPNYILNLKSYFDYEEIQYLFNKKILDNNFKSML